MNDVRTAKFANEQRPVPELGDDRADVFDAKQPIDWCGRHGVDRDDPRINPPIKAPSVDQLLRLHRMTANDPVGRDNDRDSEWCWQGILHTAEVSGCCGLQGTRRHETKRGWIFGHSCGDASSVTVAANRDPLSVRAYRSEITAPKH